MAKTIGRETKPIAFGSRYLNESETKYSIGELELLAVVWGFEKFRFFYTGRKFFFIQTAKHLNC